MPHIQRLAILSAAIALLAAPVLATPRVVPPNVPVLFVPVQGSRNGYAPSIPGIGGFLGAGGGFGGGLGGGRYNSWGNAPPPPPTYQPPVYNTYQPPAQTQAYQPPPPRMQPQPQAPVVADTPVEHTSIRRTTTARPVPNAQPNYLATLSGVKGDTVSVRSGGGAFTTVSSGRQLIAGDDLATGPDTEVTLTLRDGSSVIVGAATQINLAAFDEKNPTKALVNLKIGEISPKVTMGASTGYNFGVKTERASVSIREANFTIRYDKQSDLTTVSTEDGSVYVVPTNTSLQPTTVAAGQEADITVNRIVASAPVEIAADAPTAPAPDAGSAPAVSPPANPAGLKPVVAASVKTTVSVSDGDPAAAAVPTPAGDASAAAAAPTATQTASTDATAPAAAAAPADLSGSWINQDGSVVKLTQNGTQVSWNYKGPAGHESLTGSVTGNFDGRFFVGTFRYKDGDAEGNGTITLTLDGNKLVGGWVATNPAGSTGSSAMTRQ
jgi:hypothetical protein